MLWRRTLGWQPYTLLDMARGSSGVAIREGSVYGCNGMGIVARCDARDGALDWVRGYASQVDADPQAGNGHRVRAYLGVDIGRTKHTAPSAQHRASSRANSTFLKAESPITAFEKQIRSLRPNPKAG